MWPFNRKKREPDEPQAESESAAASPASDGPGHPASGKRVRGPRTFTFQLAGLESELVFRGMPSPLAVDEIQGFDPPRVASGYLVFADEEHNIGGAYFCTDPQSGRVFRVDPENSTAFELVNTTMDAFRASMEAAARWSAQHGTAAIGEHPETVDELASRLSAIDPAAFGSPDSLWPGLVDQIREGAKEVDEEMELWFRIT